MQADTVEQAVTGDAVAVEFAAMVSRLGELARDPAPGADAARIDRIALLERLRGAVAAAQHAEQVAFARSQAAAQILDDRVDPRMVGRGIADQIALARHISPVTGSRQLETGRALQAELPQTYQLLATGRISERVAELIVSQTRHLHPPQRVVVDKQLAETAWTSSHPPAPRRSSRSSPTQPTPPPTWRAGAPPVKTAASGCAPHLTP